MIRFFSKICQILLDHELMQFYCGHQSKVPNYKKVSTNKLLIMANLIYITLSVSLKKVSTISYVAPRLLGTLEYVPRG